MSSSSSSSSTGTPLGPIFSRYQKTKFLYPWTEHSDPYAVWISEIMLQQTVVSAVVPFFNRWMKAFPDIRTLAKAEEEELLRYWEGLGYYSRCRNILKAAKVIVEKYQGELPSSLEDLKALPGLGDYTAKAILCQGFEIPAVAVDANIKRIALRFFFSSDSPEESYQWTAKRAKEIIPLLEEESLLHSPPLFHNALMQFGQQVCKAQNPLCKECPINQNCRGFAAGEQNNIPPVKKRTTKEKKSRLALILSENNSQSKIILVKRDKGIGKGLWFIPNVNELPDNLKRDLPTDPRPLKKRVHLYTTNREELSPFLYKLPEDLILPEELNWFEVSELPDLPVASVYRKILTELEEILN